MHVCTQPWTGIHELYDPELLAWGLGLSHKLNARFNTTNGEGLCASTHDVVMVVVVVVEVGCGGGIVRDACTCTHHQMAMDTAAAMILCMLRVFRRSSS